MRDQKMATQAQILLVEKGRPLFGLEMRPPQDTEPVLEALAELILHVEWCLGRKMPWAGETSRPPPMRLILHFCPERGMAREEFEIAAKSDSLTIAASTVTGMGHAVHYFLETAFQVRWLWPGPSGTVCPPATNISWPVGVTRHKPAWQWRRLWLGGAFWCANDPVLAELRFGGVSAATLTELQKWQKRNRLGGLTAADGHRWCQICPPEIYGETHPEYFALVNGRRDTVRRDGKHGNQPCTSNPEVIWMTAQYVLAQFRARPELDAFSISLNDGSGFCECAQCRALDEAEAKLPAGKNAIDKLTQETAGENQANRKSEHITARVFHFTNAVAAQVAQTYPDKLLIMLVYSVYRKPPRNVHLHPNVIAQFCAMSFTHSNARLLAEDSALLRELADTAPRRGIYDYFVNGANGTLPRGFARIFCRSLRTYYETGCRYFAAQAGLDFATNGLVYYTAARLLWNPELSFDDILDDYCRSGFGPAAESVRNYLTAFQTRWEAHQPAGHRHEAMVMELYPPAWRLARRRELEAALTAAERQSEVKARIRFLMDGLDFLDLYAKACAAALELLNLGAPPVLTEIDGKELRAWIGQSRVERAALEQAAACRAQLMHWVAQHRDGFWITAMWFYYYLGNRGGIFGRWMDIVMEEIIKR